MSLRTLRYPSYLPKRALLYFSQTRSNHTSTEVNSTSSASVEADAPDRKVSGSAQIFSGIQPTGVPHLGNYLGALRPWKDLVDAAAARPGTPSPTRRLFCIVDMHALTGFKGAQVFKTDLRESQASLVALGLTSDRSTVFVQSHVPAHTELMWLLSTVASTGYLSRMTQWKSKLSLSEEASLADSEANEKLKLGLFSYPVLQAADILLYRATLVPVGEDQAQHIEFTRDLARRFNHAYCRENPLLRLPEPLISPAKRIMSLRKPEHKMSKSDPDSASRILVTDSEETIRARIKAAVTDSNDGISYDPAARPGLANLIDILRHVTRDQTPPEDIARDMADMSFGALKTRVADVIVDELRPLRERFLELTETEQGLQTVSDTFALGAKRARTKAGNLMHRLAKDMGLFDHRHHDDASKRNRRKGVIQRPAEVTSTGEEETGTDAKRRRVDETV